MNKLETIKTIVNIFGIITIPIVSLIIGNNYTRAIKEREIQGKFVELAVGILNDTPNPDNKNIRGWAVDIINSYSGVKFSSETRLDLINRIPINYDSENEIQNVFETALESYNFGDYSTSQKLCTKLIFEYRPSADMLSKIILLEGKSFYKLGDYEEAKKSLGRLVKSQSAAKDIKEEAGIILLDLKNK